MRVSIVVSALAGLALSSTVLAQAEFPNRWREIASGGLNGTADAGQSLALANVTDSSSSNPADQLLLTLRGSLVNRDDVDIYCIRIADIANFSASTNGPPGNTSSGDTILALLGPNGEAISWNDNRPESAVSLLSTLTNTQLVAGGFLPGLYYIAVGRNDLTFGGTFQAAALDSAGNPIFPFTAPPPDNGSATDRRAQFGPITAGTILDSWRMLGGGFQPFNANYNINLTGAAFAVPGPGVLSLLSLAGIAAMRRKR